MLFQIIFLIAQQPLAYGGVRLEKGWGIITLLYQSQRQLYLWGRDDSLWLQNRDKLGMGLFPRVGNASLPWGSDRDVRTTPTYVIAHARRHIPPFSLLYSSHAPNASMTRLSVFRSQ